jgi:hypothetical protein
LVGAHRLVFIGLFTISVVISLNLINVLEIQHGGVHVPLVPSNLSSLIAIGSNVSLFATAVASLLALLLREACRFGIIVIPWAFLL